MGNSGSSSNSSSSGEEEETEAGSPGPQAAPAPSPASQPKPGGATSTAAYCLPAPGVLLDQARLREVAARLRHVAVPESVVVRNQSALIRWLEERLCRGEEVVILEQFCEMLENRTGTREECEEAFAQFDAEGDGTVDIESMLEALKSTSGANLQGELSHVIRQLQACSLTPGFVDIFCKSKERLRCHTSKIHRFLHRNRISSSAIPFPALEGYNNVCTMRSSVVRDYLEQLLQKENEMNIQKTAELYDDSELDELRIITKCYNHIETSSNSADICKMTNGETTSFWQSDGNARSHWIRLRMKSNILLSFLSIAVAADDQSYMPQQVTVSAGRNPNKLQEIREIHIPSNVTGYVTLLENANIKYPFVQINIKRCLSDGCDTRIHGLRTLGVQVMKKAGVSVSDASAIWYLSLLTSLVTTSMETNSALVHVILQNTQKALQHMPPLSLTSNSTEFPKFLSPNVLEEVDGFLVRIAGCCDNPEAELTLLTFALARGSVAKVIISLSNISDHPDLKYKASSLICSMATVRNNLLYKYGKPLQLILQGCDVKGKDETSGPENLVVEPWTGDGFLSETGQTRASVIVSTGNEFAFQVTQVKIKVRIGAIGAKCGLVFAYNHPAEKLNVEEHFKRFEMYDQWKLQEYRQFVRNRSLGQGTELTEDDPVGWFELKEDWDEVEVKLLECRITKYLMVKFLCTRQDTAERLGVQGLSVFGYLRTPEEKPSIDSMSLKCDGPEEGLISGMLLLLKTLCFIQQLAEDLAQQKEIKLKHKSYLDFTDLNLQVFWNFYNKLRQNPREEYIYAQTVLLQLLQNCFSVLSGIVNQGSRESCCVYFWTVVDVGSDESPSLKALKKAARNTILNGAAIFFPDSQTRRDQLFTTMKNITEQQQPESVHLTFRSLCSYFSNQDPSGLLLLSQKGVPPDFDVGPVLTVMDTVLLVTSRECELMMTTEASNRESGAVLFSLLWVLQGSLLSWCYLQLKSSDPVAQRLARDILVKYVNQYLSRTSKVLKSLITDYSAKDVMDKLDNSVLSMATRQLVIFLLEFCSLDIPHCTLLKAFIPMTELLKSLCSDAGESFSKMDLENWQQPQQPSVLRTWTMESPHNYDNNRHETTVFVCPGAAYFELEFDEKCETEKKYDYLEFTDARGVKMRYDTKVGTEKWPKKVTIKAGPWLQFLFHSDSSNNEWGYKFTVTAYGLSGVTVSWGSDLYLCVSRLMGCLASRTMALKSTCELGCAAELPTGKVASVINSPLWKAIFRHGKCAKLSSVVAGTSKSSTPPQETKQSQKPPVDEVHSFLVDFMNWDSSQDSSGPRSDLKKTLSNICKKQCLRTEIVKGSKVDQAVNAIFSAMVYHTPDLHKALRKYVVSGDPSALSEDFSQVYSLAEGIRTWMLEMKQKCLMGKMDETEKKRNTEEMEMNPESLAQTCIEKSLLLLQFPPVGTRNFGVRYSDSDTEGLKSLQAGTEPLRVDSASKEVLQAANSLPSLKVTQPGSTGSLTKDLASMEFLPAADLDAKSKPKEGAVSPLCQVQAELTSVSLSNLQSEVPSSPFEEPSTPFALSRKTSFSRGRLRLRSLISMEESRLTPTIKEKYPLLKSILGFFRDLSVSQESILQVLSLRKAQAQSIQEVLTTVHQCLDSLGQPHLFQAPCVLFLMELLASQKDFATYFGSLDGCGPELRKEIREYYHQIVLILVNAVKSFNDLNNKSLLPALSCVQTCLLHLLDMSWEPEDLSFFTDINLPYLLLSMSQENIRVHNSTICQWSEEDEIADYKQNCEWMDECQDGMFETWYEKIDCAAPEKKRKMHMFIARYCDLLNVEISCDGCDKIAPWHCYRCLQCNDMDLCKTCFLGGVKSDGHEDDHDMVHMEYACNHCQGLIIGRRINCNVCEDFDLCYGCYFAKKYPDSHLPTHSITVYPMVTIRISDHQRLIQPYIHNYSWLLFTALTLYTSDLASEEEVEGDRLDPHMLTNARALQTRCTELIADCLLKAQQGKVLRRSAVLSLLSASEPCSEHEATATATATNTNTKEKEEISVNTSPAVQSLDTPELKGLAAAVQLSDGVHPQSSIGSELKGGQESGVSDTIAIQDEPESKTKELLQTLYTLQARVTSTLEKYECSNTQDSDSSTNEQKPEVASQDQVEKNDAMPNQEQMFAECSQERILGLLAAMLPPAKLTSPTFLGNLKEILVLLFQVVISNAGHLNETYHLTLGLLGQLLLRISPAEADAAVSETLVAKQALFSSKEGSLSQEGWKTTQLLFTLGAMCLDSRVGLDWACSMADVLRDLNSCPQWHNVIATFTEHCVRQLPFQLKRTNIFTLLVLVGFPEVLCMGSRSVYLCNSNEPHNVIILKHFTEKNLAIVVNVKTRKKKTVKDYQLVQCSESESKDSQCQSEAIQQAQLRQHIQHFVFITSHLLKTNLDSSCTEAVEATWVLSLALKGLYNTLKKHGAEEIQASILQSDLIKLLVKKCSKGTGFSKTWLLRDLEILSIMLYSSKKEINSIAECTDPEAEEKQQDQDVESFTTSNIETDQNKPDPLEGLDEATKICFQLTHDALNAPLHILRAMYELQMKRTDCFFLEIHKRFDGEAIAIDETIQTLAQKWQPPKRPRTEEPSAKAVDTDMVITSSVSKPVICDKATEETNPVTQKLITNTESDLQLSYAKQRRTKSSLLLHKELDARSKKSVRNYLYKVNEAITILYARHVLASLLAEWPNGVAVTEDALELGGPSHMAYILDMLMQLEEKQLWEKILQKVLLGCSESMLGTLALTACQFMEEPGMAVQVRESKHPYDNNTTFEDKVHIPGAIYLWVKFDRQCNTEEGCDELLMSSSYDFQQDLHSFSGSHQKWIDFEIPGDTLYYKFTSDMSNTEWGYKFTVTGGHHGRFMTGFEILKQMLSDERALQHLPLADIWEWQVGVACRQTGYQRMKAIHLLLKVLRYSSSSNCNLTLLRPLWQLLTKMENELIQDTSSTGVLLPLHRALTRLFFIAENRATELGCLQDYLLALTTEDQLHRYTVQALKNIAAISLAINYPNKATKLLNISL
nr:PREDICTED: zinc finger ZZ-type and EF-hand domain-containing protein 1 [Latimeria chalumnae]|eukprot:XP_014350788.1 PREDICTED: zinc finger ZZ-type and EF-hand domain-containing protein 1 [Latimeria chalumnae]